MTALSIPLLLCIPTLVSAFDASMLAARDGSPLGYYNPSDSGGGLIDYIPGPDTVGVGEPVNAILSGNSDKDLLVDQETNGGLRNYFLSFGFAGECLGQHSGTDHAVNLGDGNGLLNETAVMRWDYGDAALGTCTETIQGGSHFRYWVQDGKDKDSGAVFMAYSYEMPIAEQHGIVLNGYNLGRDWAVGNVTNQTSHIDTFSLNNASAYQGQTAYGGYTYQTSVQYVWGLLPNTSSGVNHASTVEVPGLNAVDGWVAFWEAKIVTRPQGSSASHISLPWACLPLITTLAVLSFFS